MTAEKTKEQLEDRDAAIYRIWKNTIDTSLFGSAFEFSTAWDNFKAGYLAKEAEQ